MATKKTKKRQTKLKKTAPKKKPGKKAAKKKLLKTKKTAPKKKLAKTAKKKPAQKKTVVKTAAATKRQVQVKGQSSNIESFTSEEVRARSAGQSGGLQGLSNAAGADSESVDELIEEGNAFEAGIVSGVETADGADEQEVRTREVPEDDVPDEYLEQD